MYGFTLGKYSVTELVSPEVSTEGTTCGNLEGFFLGDWIGSLDRIEIGTNAGNQLGLSDWEVLGRTLGYLVVI